MAFQRSWGLVKTMALGNAPIIQVKNLSVSYDSSRGEVHALRSVDLEVGKGEIIGIVGESGCGKSTLGTTLLNLMIGGRRLVDGEILYNGLEDSPYVNIFSMPYPQLRRYRWGEVSMVFQSSMNSLNPVLRVKEQIADVMIDHDYNHDEINERVDRFLRLAGLNPRVRDMFPHELSGGMKQRVAIAMALSCDPKVVILDEPTTALDVVVQKQFLTRLKKLAGSSDLTVIFITHDISILVGLADRVAVMYGGKVAEIGKTEKIFESPSHPYTKALIGSLVSLENLDRKPESIKGKVVNLRENIVGCAFSSRCQFVMAKCHDVEPLLRKSESGSLSACHLVDSEGVS